MEESKVKDLTLRCSNCKHFFALSSMLQHKKHHKAMRIMRFKEGKGPRNIDSLTKRHMMLLQKVLTKFKDTPTDPNLAKRLEKINDAYETLRFEFTKDESRIKSMLGQEGMTSMRDGYFEPRDRTVEDPVKTEAILTSGHCGFPSCIYGIGQSQAINTDWRDKLEDATTISTQLPRFLPQHNESGVCFIGMFDGHHGETAAQTCAESMCGIISQQFLEYRRDQCSKENATQQNLLSTEITDADESSSETKLSDAEISRCLTKSYQKMDQYLGHGINESSRLRWSGCSALTCLIIDEENSIHVNERGDAPSNGPVRHGSQTASEKTSKNAKIGKAYVSNTGNVRAVLYHKKKPHVLSQLHTLENCKEQKRIIAAGGSVNSSERYTQINGVLDTTRSLGNHGDPVLKKCVITSPHTSVSQLTGESQMLVIATNSVWDVLNPSDVLSVLVHSMPSDVANVLRSGPTPIVPVIHGHLRGGRKGAADGSEAHQISSTLPSIVETEEEQEIEEVIFVEAQESDSEDEEKMDHFVSVTVDSAMGDGGHSTDSSLVNKTDGDEAKEQAAGPSSIDENASFFSGDGNRMAAGDLASQKERIVREKYARVASVLSDQLVRASIVAGAVDNVSVVVILFKGMFSP